MSPLTPAQRAQYTLQLPEHMIHTHQVTSRTDDFLARVGRAEGRDSARSGAARRITAHTSPTHRQHARQLSSENWAELLDWRASQQKDAAQRAAIQAAANPAVQSHPRYMTEQQRQHLAVQEAHQQAIASKKHKDDEEAMKRELMESSASAALRATQHSAPALAFRPLSTPQNAMLPSEDQKRRLSLQHSMRVVQAHATAHAQAARAPNASAAQAQAVRIAQHEEKWRDPRGRAFRVA